MARHKRTHLSYNPRLRPIARQLRKQGVLSEVLLWNAIRNKSLGCEFHRQVPIGEYIVDFFCPEHMLALEIDGCSHEHPEVHVEDNARQAELEAMGVRFLRFQDREVRDNLQGAVDRIAGWLETSPLIPLQRGNGGEGHPP